MTSERRLRPASLALQNFHHDKDATGSVVPPIYPSATYARDNNYELVGGYNYARYGTPNVDYAERLLSSLDMGSDALLFASGLAAVTTLLDTLDYGARIVAPQVMYHGAQDWLRRLVDKRGADLVLFNQTISGDLERCIDGKKTDIVWLETPCNPTWDIVDIEEASSIAKDVGALLAVDSTVAPPCTTRALEHGADIVFHSATKYLNGHHDISGGVLVTGIRDERWEELRLVRKLMGNIMSPKEAWMLIRGIRTLFVRFSKCSANAMTIAEYFEDHPRIDSVLYPGLKRHPGHQIAKKQMSNGFGGMLSLLIKGGSKEAKHIATSCRLFTPATSLGGVESLIEHRKSVEGPHSTVPNNLLRLSVGIEDVDDLIFDLDQALK